MDKTTCLTWLPLRLRLARLYGEGSIVAWRIWQVASGNATLPDC
jgi:hypothetical protein